LNVDVQHAISRLELSRSLKLLNRWRWLDSLVAQDQPTSGKTGHNLRTIAVSPRRGGQTPVLAVAILAGKSVLQRSQLLSLAANGGPTFSLGHPI